MSGAEDRIIREHDGLGEDERILLRVACGDQAALARLIDRHGRGLRVFAARYLGSTADADDVVQEVFVTVWKRAAGFNPAKGRASTWLYRITANRCIDARRRRSLRALIGLDVVQDTLVEDEPHVDTRLGARQELAVVRHSLSRLPERQRRALLLRAVADLDVSAIAEVMASSTGSVEQLLVRARRTLKQKIAETRK